MIGLLFGLLHIGVRGINVGTRIYNEHKNKQESIKHGDDFYLDRNGQTRRLCDNQLTVTVRNQHGDLIKKNPITGQVYKNIDLEKRRQYEKMMQPEKEIAIANGQDLYLFDANTLGRPHYPCLIANLCSATNNRGDQYIKGKIWKHVDSGKLYVKRSIKTFDESVTKDERDKYLTNIFESAIVYMDLSNGMIVPEIIGWDCFTKNEPSEWSRKRIMRKIDFYNKKGSDGRYLNRSNSDQWLNYNLPLE